ncbi:transcription factor bHLH112-like protein [Gossypium australe]|uniref:Transcription factor bHLH112-like protein n=1 Tax=Gossypium australe TaxID=47621 RepID=A0A5B6V0Z3_9ROSI|nr:transcription factor bHLH112-like protein [Gossypium australe]
MEMISLLTEIEKTARRNRREVREVRQGQQILIDDKKQKDITVEIDNKPVNPQLPARLALRTMYNYAKPTLIGIELSITRLTITTNNFEINPNTIQMVRLYVQFDGLQDDDLNVHLANFLEIYNVFKINGVTDDAIRLRLFPFSLRNKAK